MTFMQRQPDLPFERSSHGLLGLKGSTGAFHPLHYRRSPLGAELCDVVGRVEGLFRFEALLNVQFRQAYSDLNRFTETSHPAIYEMINSPINHV